MAIKDTQITVPYYALDTGNTTYKTGDSGNHTLKVIADGVQGSVSNSPSEVDSTNNPGLYTVIVTTSENSGYLMTLHGKSSTADVVLIPFVWDNVANLTHISGTAVSTSSAQIGVNVVSLDNDVITSAKFDESSAYPLASADSGSTQIARVGADGDTLETLSDQIDLVSTTSTSDVTTSCKTALQAYDLDHFIETSAGSEEPTDGTYLDRIMHKDSSQTFSSTTDSLEALGDKISTGTFSVTSVVDGDDVTVYRGTTWGITFSDLGSIANYSKLWFTAKDELSDPDAQAIIQVVKYSSGSGDGLVYINSASAPSGWSSKASISITSLTNGDGSIAVDESATAHINPCSDKHYDIKILRTTGAVDVLADGEESFTVKGDSTRAIS